jgi:hypothetical protein
MIPAKAPERCARCALDIAAHRTEVNGRVYCTAFCARQAALVIDGAAVAVVSARARVVARVKAKGARA